MANYDLILLRCMFQAIGFMNKNRMSKKLLGELTATGQFRETVLKSVASKLQIYLPPTH